MNCKNSISVLIFILSPYLLLAQSISQSLGMAVSDYNVTTINANRILAEFESMDFDGNIDLFLNKGLSFSLELIDSRILGSNYFAVNNSGERIKERSIFTMQGKIRDVNGSKVRLTVSNDFIYGFIDEGNGTMWFIEPAWYYDKKFNENWYVIYKQEDVNMLADGWCAASETQSRSLKLKEQYDSSRLPGSCFEVELAIASDFSMYQKYGNSIPGVENHNIAVMNNVQGNYDDEFADELFFVIVEQYISTCSTCDPWSNSTAAGTLLASFRNWAPTGFSNTHDVGQMWTNRDFDGGTVGIAYVGVVCSSFRYHCLSDFTSNAAWLRVMTAHEIGHNFDAVHDPSGSNTIMAPVVSSATQWSVASINDITSHYLSRTCLATCPPPAPPVAEFFANYTNICEGSMIQFVDESTNSPTSWNWSFPGGAPSSSTSQHPTVTYNNPGTFNVTLIASNGNGSNQIIKNAYITVGSGGTEILFYDNFESGLGNWTVDNPDNGETWESVNVGGSIAGNNVAKMDNFNYFGGNGDADALISPVIDLTGRANAQLDIQYAYTRYNSTTIDSFNVWVSLNGGASYSQLVFNDAENGSGNFATVADQTSAFTPVDPSDWCYASTYNNNGCISIDFSPFFNEDNLVFKIENVSDYGNNLYIDNVTFTSDCQVIAPPIADFNSDIQSGCVPFAVQFFDQSQNNPDTWSWTFPGGTPSSSSMQNPVILYSTPGNFDVSLTTSNFAGSSSITKSFYITALDVPNPSFLADINGNIVIFTNTTTGASSYQWDFGDGTSSTLQDPVHNYVQDGEYTVILTAFNSCGSASTTQILIIVTPPVADFSSNVNTGCVPLTVQFTDQSSSNTTSWLWSFPGGTPSSSTLENPQVVYNSAGSYNVSLQVSNAAGSNTIIQTNYITVNDTPTANYSFNINDQIVNFTNLSGNADSYIWNFGDGASSTLENPTHDYGMDGNYTVQLIAINECGNDTIEQLIIVSTLPTAGLDADVTEGCVPLTVQFTDQSSSNVDTWLWIFEGGNPSSSSLQNPVVVYENPGVFDVILEVGNENGTDIMNLMNYISVGDIPTGSFSYAQDQLDVDFQNTSSNADDYLWLFGDGNSSTQTNPSHTYDEDGNYVVSLIAINECGNDTSETILNLFSSTVAGATADNTEGCIPFVVQFTDQSSENVTNWNWTFEGGSPGNSTLQNPLVQYNNVGTFDVQLIVSNANFSDTLFLADYISVDDIPISSYTEIIDDLDVVFQNNSTNANSYLWNFGDGNTSSLENPTHSYAQDGSYTVELIVTNQCGSDTMSATITVVSPPQAGASANNTNGCIPMTVNFNDESTSNVTNWNWSFEGGSPSTSNLQNPVVLYTIPGIFDVQLIVSNSTYSDTILLEDYISVGDLPSSNFNSTTDNLQVQFTNNSTNADSYSWDFGDGETSNLADPSHVYDADGTYLVSLISTNACGSDTLEQLISVVSVPQAGASANITNGCIPMTVNFNDESTSNVTSWNWSFEGGDPSTSNLQNPVVLYTIPGIFNVQLIVSNDTYSDTILLEDYITVGDVPTSNFNATTDDLQVQFTNNSANADSYSWDFGDGETSNLADPSHVYDADGTYLVSLISTNACGSDTLEQLISVASPPQAEASANITSGCIPLSVSFNDESTANVTNWNWSFEGGDPSTSNLQNPVVLYSNPGIFDVQLIVSNGVYSDTILLADYITVGDVPTSNFISTTDDLQVQFTNSSTNADSYSWEFGDGEASNLTNPSHIYDTDGTYMVRLISTNGCGSDTLEQIVTVVSPPAANFIVDSNTGCLPFAVQYTDQSSNNVETWFWSFQGGNPAVSNLQNPQVTYNSVGNFDVQLIVSNSAYSDTISFQQFIVVKNVPNAGFQVSPNGADVVFNNNSTNAENYLWLFGDGNSSTDEEPMYSYAEEGSYEVTLIASNECGSDTVIHQINASSLPTANFQANTSFACLPAEIQFMNQSSPNAESFEWVFEGGMPASSTELNPLVSYNAAGSYDVQMIAHSLSGSDTLLLVDYIVIGDIPESNFNYAINANQIIFENLSVDADSYFWDFGNNTFSAEINPIASYMNDGSYLVELIAYNLCGQDTFQTTITITAFPNAGFSSNVVEGCTPLEVKFTDASSGNVTNWNWAFEGGTPASSNEQNPTVIYNEPGNYKVTLQVQNGVGGNTLSLQDYILVVDPPLANFDFQIQESLVSFSNMSEDATNYDWNFGDGKTSTDEHPEHIYFESGSFDVVLIASNEFCSDTIMQQIELEVSGLNVISFLKEFTIAPNPAENWVYLKVNSNRKSFIGIEIWNILGQRVLADTWDLQVGTNFRELNVFSFSSGTYLVKIIEPEGFIVRKLIIE